MDNYAKLKIALSFILVLSLVSAPAISALGVSSPYWKDNPLKMYPGQVKEVPFALVNSPSEKGDATAFATLIEGREIAEIISGEEYAVSPGSTDKKVMLRISIPQDANIGDSYNIGLSIKSAPPKEAGTVQLNIGYVVNFPVFVVSASEATVEIKTTEAKKEISKIVVLIPLIILAIIIVVILYLLRRTKKQI